MSVRVGVLCYCNPADWIVFDRYGVWRAAGLPIISSVLPSHGLLICQLLPCSTTDNLQQVQQPNPKPCRQLPSHHLWYVLSHTHTHTVLRCSLIQEYQIWVNCFDVLLSLKSKYFISLPTFWTMFWNYFSLRFLSAVLHTALVVTHKTV